MSKLVFSSDQLPPNLGEKARFETWRGRFCEMFGENDFGISEAPFAVRTTFIQLNEVLVGHSSGTVSSSEHGDDKGARGGGGRVGLLVNCSASAFYSCNRGREQLVAPGDAVFLKRAYARKIAGKDHHNAWIILEMPERSLLPAGRSAEDLIGNVIPGAGECMRLLTGYAGLLCAQESVSDPLIRAHLGSTLTDLAVLALRSSSEAEQQARERGLKSARLRAILGAIAEGYRDPAFSAAAVSRHLKLSVRTIQDLLQESGTGFSDRVMELRLARAAQLLTCGKGERKISDVAFDCGFNDLSYFHRCFRRRFGMTPGSAKAA